jgi:type II secretory pathway pseudopilin PulG
MEIMIVLVIIALLASIIVPRFSGMQRREFNLVVDQVVDLMTMYAQREQLQQQTVGLRYDVEFDELQLVVLRQDGQTLGASRTIDWVIDPYVRPVELPEDVTLLEVTADGDTVDITDFALASSPMEPRPTIVIVLQGENDTATITLPAHAITPEMSSTSRRLSSTPVAVDLDGAGRGREEW